MSLKLGALWNFTACGLQGSPTVLLYSCVVESYCPGLYHKPSSTFTVTAQLDLKTYTSNQPLLSSQHTICSTVYNALPNCYLLGELTTE